MNSTELDGLPVNHIEESSFPPEGSLRTVKPDLQKQSHGQDFFSLLYPSEEMRSVFISDRKLKGHP